MPPLYCEELRMEELLEEWKKRLGLEEWTISLEDGLYELSLPDCAGCTEWTEVNKTAKIQLIDEKAYGERIVPYDKEKTLVHELLHLKMCFLQESENELQNRIVHQLIEDMAKALVSAKRKS